MKNLFKILLMLHIIGGSVSLLLGSYIMLVKKGNTQHKLLGNLFFYTMLIAALVALPMSYLHPNYFLFVIGSFTTYMLLSGKRYLGIKNTQDVTAMDWLLTGVMLLFSLGFVGLGVWNVVAGFYFGLVLLAFGLISLIFVYSDWQNYLGKSAFKNFGLSAHLQRMIGSYIASATAFLVVNNKFLPSIIAWLLPTLVLVPLIFKWSRRYSIKK